MLGVGAWSAACVFNLSSREATSLMLGWWELCACLALCVRDVKWGWESRCPPCIEVVEDLDYMVSSLARTAIRRKAEIEQAEG